MFKNFTPPTTCGKCKFLGRYSEGPFVRNPHCCCELMFDLYDEDYRVKEDTLDKNCPLKDLDGGNSNAN